MIITIVSKLIRANLKLTLSSSRDGSTFAASSAPGARASLRAGVGTGAEAGRFSEVSACKQWR